MQYLPLTASNVSETRSTITSFSFKLDDRGYPHFVWLENKGTLNYSYWDGLKWDYVGTQLVSICDSDAEYIPNALCLDSNYNPTICFIKDNGSFSTLKYYYRNGDSWDKLHFDTNYVASWIGQVKYYNDYNMSTSFSSSSTSSSSSKPGDSSSSSSFMSESSFSSSSYSTSSSSISSSSSLIIHESSSSESEGNVSTSSSSSSSYGDSYTYVVVYDYTAGMFRIYLVGETWTLLGSQVYSSLSDFSTLKISIGGSKIGIAFVENNTIKYNFFDLEDYAWSFANFALSTYSALYGTIVDMDFKQYIEEDRSVIAMSWLSYTSTDFYVNCCLLYDNLEEKTVVGLTPNVYKHDTSTITVSSSVYLAEGFRNIGLTLDSSDIPSLLCTGQKSSYFQVSGNWWTEKNIDIKGIANQIKTQKIECDNQSESVGCLINGNVYYFYYSGYGLEMVDSTIGLASPEWLSYGTYSPGELSITNIANTYDSPLTTVLGENKKPLIYYFSENGGPDVPTTTTTTTTATSACCTTMTCTGASCSYFDSFVASGLFTSNSDGCTLYGRFKYKLDGSVVEMQLEFYKDSARNYRVASSGSLFFPLGSTCYLYAFEFNDSGLELTIWWNGDLPADIDVGWRYKDTLVLSC